MVNGPPPPDGPWRRGSPPAPDILWDLFISFSPPHKKKSFYISTFLHLKSSWSRCFFFAKIYYLGKVPTKCRPSGRCFGVHLFEIFREKIRYFENFDQWSKYCRCRMGDHEVRVFAHHCCRSATCYRETYSTYVHISATYQGQRSIRESIISDCVLSSPVHTHIHSTISHEQDHSWAIFRIVFAKLDPDRGSRDWV